MSKPTKMLGIDPGRNGALALWDIETGDLQLWSMPDTPAGVYELIMGMSKDVIGCALESPIYMARTGTKNVSTMAFNYGVLYTSLVAAKIPFKELAPKRWKGSMDLSKDKRDSLKMAQALFPSNAGSFKRLKDDGLAEAALLAHFAANSLRWVSHTN